MIEFTDLGLLSDAERRRKELIHSLPTAPGYYVSSPSAPGGGILCELKDDGKFHGSGRILSEPERYAPYSKLVPADSIAVAELSFDDKLRATREVLDRLLEEDGFDAPMRPSKIRDGISLALAK